MKVHTIVLDRSDPDEVIGYDPETKKNLTRLDELKKGIHCRRDIAVVNTRSKCPTCKTEDVLFKQYEVYATESGEPTGNGWKFVEDKDKERCREINRALIEIAKLVPEMKWFLKGKEMGVIG